MAVLAALVSCGQARSAGDSHSSHGTPRARLVDTLFDWVPFNEVTGLAAISAHDVWAVGSTAKGKPLIERWDGLAWKPVASAIPHGATESLLTSVAATRSSNAWAVGYYNTGKEIRTLIERWNGHGWAQVASPSPGGLHGSELLGVAATGPSNAWAVGEYSNSKALRTLVEHWNGRTWVWVPSPSPGGSHSYCALNGVASAGKASAWAVGFSAPPVRPMIERWNGRIWKVVASPNPAGRFGGALNAVTTIGGSEAWAVGNKGNGKVIVTMIERWNGRAWKAVPSPLPIDSGGSDLTAVAAASAGRAWAVGYYFADTMFEPAVFTVIERWNGRAWKQEPSPSPGGLIDSGPDQSLLYAVAAISSSQAWAAGSFSSGNPKGTILIERRHGGTWTYLPI
jgi:hypothetical protein